MGFFDNKSSGMNLPVSYVHSLFDNVKDSTGKPVEKLDTNAFLSMLQTAVNNGNNKDYATQLLHLVSTDIKAGMINQQLPTDGIAALDGDATTYSKADFTTLGTVGSYLGKTVKGNENQQTDRIDQMDYMGIMLMRNKKRTDQMMQQIMQSTNMMMQSATSGLNTGTPNTDTVSPSATTGQTSTASLLQSMMQTGQAP